MDKQKAWRRQVLTEPSHCKRCGAEFRCSASPKCWCYEVDISPARLEELHRKYDGCLCPECLNNKELNAENSELR